MEARPGTAVTTVPRQVPQSHAQPLTQPRPFAPPRVVTHLDQESEDKDNDNWILVQKKKTKEKFKAKEGKANVEPNSRFKAADYNIPIYIYNVNKSTNEQDIIDYVLNKTKVTVKPEKIILPEGKKYNSYRIYIPKREWHLFDDDAFWPEGIFFRRYFIFHNKNGNKPVNPSSNIPQHNGSDKK